jgi:hypothetical protein
VFGGGGEATLHRGEKLKDVRRLSGSEIRRLLELRELIKVESFRLSTARQRKLLELLERSRPWKDDPQPLPEMSRGELVRAIRWRLGTISLPTAIEAARMVAARRRKTQRVLRG